MALSLKTLHKAKSHYNSDSIIEAPLDRLLWMGVPESLVAQLTDTILSMQAASSRGEVDMEPVLRDLLTKLSTDASNFLGSLNQFCKAVSEGCPCTVQPKSALANRQQERNCCCSPTCSCCSTDSEEIDCESLDCECDLEPVCSSVLPKNTLEPKDSSGVACQVCVLEEEITEVSTYRIDPVTKKIKISKVEEYSQITKQTNLKSQSMQTCECLDSENIKAYGDAVVKSAPDKKPLLDYNKIKPAIRITETEPLPHENKLKQLPEEDETEPPASDTGFVTDQEAEKRGDVSCACRTTQTELISSNQDIQTKRHFPETEQRNQRQSTVLDSSDSPSVAPQPFSAKLPNRNMQCVGVCCNCPTTQMEEKQYGSPDYVTEQESSPLANQSSQDAVDTVIEQKPPSQFNPSSLERLPCTVSTCSVLSQVPSSHSKRENKQDLSTVAKQKRGNDEQCGDTCCGCQTEEKLSYVSKHGGKEGAGAPADSLNKQELFSVSKQPSSKIQPCTPSTCSILSKIPSFQSQKGRAEKHSSSILDSFTTAEEMSTVINPTPPRTPCTPSTCSILSQAPSSYSKRENKARHDFSNQSIPKKSGCTNSTCSVVSAMSSSHQKPEIKRPRCTLSTCSAFGQSQQQNTFNKQRCDGKCGGGSCPCSAEQKESFVSKRQSDDRRSSPSIGFLIRPESPSPSNQMGSKRGPCTPSTCSVLSQVPSYSKKGGKDGLTVLSSNGIATEKEISSGNKLSTSAKPSCTPATCSVLSQVSCTPATCSVLSQVPSYSKEGGKDRLSVSYSAGFATEKEMSLQNKLSPSTKPPCTASTCSVLSQVPSYSKKGVKDGLPLSYSAYTTTEKEISLQNKLSTSTKLPCTPSNCSILSQMPAYQHKQKGRENSPLPSRRTPCTTSTCSVLSQVPSFHDEQKSKAKRPDVSSIDSITEYAPSISSKKEEKKDKCGYTCCGCHLALTELGSLNRNMESSFQKEYGGVIEQESRLSSKLPNLKKRPCTSSTCSVLSQIPLLHTKQGSKGGRSGSIMNQEPLLSTSTVPAEPHIGSLSKLSGSRGKLLPTQYSNNLMTKHGNKGECPYKLCCTCSVTESRPDFRFTAHEPVLKSKDKEEEEKHSLKATADYENKLKSTEKEKEEEAVPSYLTDSKIKQNAVEEPAPPDLIDPTITPELNETKRSKASLPASPVPATASNSEPATAPTAGPVTASITKAATASTSEPATTPTSGPVTASITKAATASTSESATAPTAGPVTASITKAAIAPTSEPATAPTGEPATVSTTEPARAPTSESAASPSSESVTAATSEPATSPAAPIPTGKRKDKDSSLPTDSAKKAKRKSKERRASADTTNKLEPLPPADGKRKSRDRKSREERPISPYSTDSTNETESVSPSMAKKKSRDVPTSESFSGRFITPSPSAITEPISTAAFESEQQSKTEPPASTDVTAQPESVAFPTEETLPEDLHPEMSLKQLFEKQREKLSVDQCICTVSRNECGCGALQELSRDKCICAPSQALCTDTCTYAPSQELPSAVDGRVKKWVERLSATEQTLKSLRAKIESFSIGVPTERQCDKNYGVPSPRNITPKARTRCERSCGQVPAFVTVGCDVPRSYPEYRENNYYSRCATSCAKTGQCNKSVNVRSTSRRPTSPCVPVHTIPLMPPQAIAIQPGSINNHQRINYNRHTRSKPRNLKDFCSCGSK